MNEWQIKKVKKPFTHHNTTYYPFTPDRESLTHLITYNNDLNKWRPSWEQFSYFLYSAGTWRRGLDVAIAFFYESQEWKLYRNLLQPKLLMCMPLAQQQLFFDSLPKHGVYLAYPPYEDICTTRLLA